MSDFNDFNNKQVANLPLHLRQFIVPQNYQKYMPIDQAVWRYVMRQNYSFLKQIAYYPYIKGLTQAGLSIEYIPDLQTMNDNLGKIGWGAVTVDGFIPPSAFMEFQAYKVLVIAADIRQIKHIQYTPAPDIIHESAGHAPIIADRDYNSYLSYFGTIGTKAMFSSKDFELYEAIRKLSILKENVEVDETKITEAEQQVKFISSHMGKPSEMALLSRLHWWTVEYGLIGTLENPKIYGAGLLSSIGESASCLDPKVEKLWYNMETINYSYDITKEQPQLFVTPTFQNLIDVLEQFADTMAFRRGGAASLLKAIECKNTSTAVYRSGLQVTGVFTEIGTNKSGEVTFLKTIGPSALAFDGKQLPLQSKTHHPAGFSSPVGKLKNTNKPLEDHTLEDLLTIGISSGEYAILTFESDISVQGVVKNITQRNNKIILISFENCTVTAANGDLLFKPAWVIYDMPIGAEIISVFNGAADKEAFEDIAPISKAVTKKANVSGASSHLQHLYQRVRKVRETDSKLDELAVIFSELRNNFQYDWLCALQILEIVNHRDSYAELAKEVRIYLERKAANESDLKKLIDDGFYVIAHPVTQYS